MRLAIVDMEEERTVVGQDSPGFLQARLQEAEKVIELVDMLARGYFDRTVALAAKADAVALRVSHGLDLPPYPIRARIEGRVDVDERRAGLGQSPQRIQIVIQNNH